MMLKTRAGIISFAIFLILCASSVLHINAKVITNVTEKRIHFESCGPNKVRCSSGECMVEDNFCNGREDCSDGSDEDDCQYVPCHSPFLFRCSYGACVSVSEVCDGKKDCKDNSDEVHCSNSSLNSSGKRGPEIDVSQDCSPGFIKCNSGECIQEHYQCDGKEDCKDGSDETNKCRGFPCNRRAKFRCAYGACIKKHLRCDGKSDCKDGSDEASCTNYAITGMTQHIPHKPNIQSDQTCGLRFSHCRSGECVSEDNYCDGKEDCRDGSDEDDCEDIPCFSPFLFRCSYGACISGKMMCDGKIDCRDQSDEKNCQHNSCSPDFRCNSGECVNRKCMCDGKADCIDNSDETEALCKTHTCSRSLFRCSYGACVHRHARCNGDKDCFDGSDEIGCSGSPSSSSCCHL